jgi:glycosyltransferase involved in cell wall biosynthesis
VVGQGYQNQEILILDNGSKDLTKDIIRTMQQQYSQIVLYDE